MGVVYEADLKFPRKSDKPVLSMNGFDFQGAWEIDNKARKVLGVHFQADAQGSRWFDPYMAAAQKAIDDNFPATINRISCGNCLSSRFLLVETQSDRQPSRYFLYDPAKGKITADVGAARPWIDQRQMGLRNFVRYPARDGLQIPAYVSTPPGWHKGDRRPLIVLVHGGPWIRGVFWEWDAEAQFLATRGYVVIQPIYRGSTGFGLDFFRAGWRQWGLAMQDDLADAARWAVAQGYADPARIAIGGASYGGYATLMGLIREPELFRCGFEIAGVTDLVTKHDFAWSDASDDMRNYSDVVLLGDPEKDRTLLEQASPIHAADRLSQPLLMAHGVDDVRVPFIQGKSFRDAVMRTNKDVQWVQYPDEGHGLSKESDRFDYWKRVEALLARHLRSGDDTLAAH
jgi:dipeptidyl aminopeptidase/acylaminoacyl peptidase